MTINTKAFDPIHRHTLFHVTGSSDHWIFIAGLPAKPYQHQLRAAPTIEQHHDVVGRIIAAADRHLVHEVDTGLLDYTYRRPRRWGSGFVLQDSAARAIRFMLERGTSGSFVVGLASNASVFSGAELARLAALAHATYRSFDDIRGYRLSIFGFVSGFGTSPTLSVEGPDGEEEITSFVPGFETDQFRIDEATSSFMLADELAAQWGLSGAWLAHMFRTTHT